MDDFPKSIVHGLKQLESLQERAARGISQGDAGAVAGLVEAVMDQWGVVCSAAASLGGTSASGWPLASLARTLRRFEEAVRASDWALVADLLRFDLTDECREWRLHAEAMSTLASDVRSTP